MSLDDIEVVDAVGTEKGTNTAVLSIIDSWDWKNQEKHLAALEDKLNAYFAFVESGQIYDEYPAATGRPLRIDIISRYPMPEASRRFLEKASDAASKLNLTIGQRVR